MPHHFLYDLRSVLATQPNRPAIIHRDRTITYSELEQLAAGFAGFLQSSGLTPGHRVVLFTENKLPFLIAHLGVVFAGGVPLPLNPRFTREEMRYFLSDSECRVVIAGEEQYGLVESLASELAFRPPVILDSAVWDQPVAPFRDFSPNSDHPCL